MKKSISFTITLLVSLLMAAFAYADVFTIQYYESEDSEPSAYETEVEFGGESVVTYTIEQLGYAEVGRVFKGWKAHRDYDDKWYAVLPNGTKDWVEAENGLLPEGCTYSLYGNSAGVSWTSPSGYVQFYAQWEENATFTVRYYESEDAEPSQQETTIGYGVGAITLTVEELGFEQIGRVFKGWKAHRDCDDKWYAQKPNGQKEWVSYVGDTLPEGYTYALYGNSAGLSRTAPSGYVQFYAQWNTEGNTILYYESEEAEEALSQSTHLQYRIPTDIYTVEELGIQTEGRIFLGWKAQRVSDGYWDVMHANNRKTWEAGLQEGDSYYLYPDGASVEGYWQSGEIHYYAQWISASIDITDPEFGANGEDEEDDYLAIQKALNYAKKTPQTVTVNVPAGDYYISSTLQIYSNTHLILNDNATISCMGGTRLMLYNESQESIPAGGYGRSENIMIQGGIWDGKGQGGTAQSNLMLIVHARDITISNVTMKNCCGNHFLELAGVKDSSVLGCTFTNYILYNGTNYDDETASLSSEAIQLDYATADNTGGIALPSDDTPCKNITISGCGFTDCVVGIGNHHEGELGEGYIIQNNRFVNILNTCISMFSMGNATIKNNTATDVERFIFATKCGVNSDTYTIVQSNTITNSNSENGLKYDGIIVLESRGYNITENRITGFKNGVFITDGSEDISVNGNTIDNSVYIGIKIYNSACNIQGNYVTNCGQYNIGTYGTSTGSIEENTYDLGYGIFNYAGMERGVNYYLYAEEEPNYFTVVYHQTDVDEPCGQTTKVEYGISTPTLTIQDLGFVKQGNRFIGWKLYRNDTKSWGVSGTNGDLTWKAEPDARDEYKLYPEGAWIARTVDVGVDLHFYAQWELYEATGILVMPGNLTKVEAEAFQGVEYVAEIVLGTHTERIEDKAFANMSGLKKITIPDSVIYIAENAFLGTDAIICCNQGSYAQQYAYAHGISWEAFVSD